MAELADAVALGATGETRAGSSPVLDTNIQREVDMPVQVVVAFTILGLVFIGIAWEVVRSLRSYDKSFAVWMGSAAVILICCWALYVVSDWLAHQ